jgi:hypothetical protein
LPLVGLVEELVVVIFRILRARRKIFDERSFRRLVYNFFLKSNLLGTFDLDILLLDYEILILEKHLEYFFSISGTL